MMSKLCTTLILLVGLVAISAHGSAIKGHQQAQSVQRVEEQARVSSVKSPASQLAERSPKSAPVQSATPILESSKKVYNDVSYRRSVIQSQASEQAQAPQAAAEPVVAPVVTQQDAAKEAPAQAAVPVAKVAEAPVVPVSKPSDELPAQSVRSVSSAKSEPEASEQRTNAGQPASSDKAKLEARQSCGSFCLTNNENAGPAAAEPKPAVSEAQVQQAPVVASQVQPEPVAKAAVAPVAVEIADKPVAPVAVESKPAVSEAQVQQAFAVPASAAAESSLQAKKDEPSAKEAHEPIEVPAPDPGLVLSEPIDSTTKLLIDLDEHVQKFLPAEDKQEPAQPPKEAVLVNGVDYSPPQAQASDSQPSGKSSVPLMPYSSNADSEPIVPPLPASLDKVDKAAAAVAPAQVPSAGQSATRQANHNQHQNQQQVITQLLDQLDSLQNRIQDTINQLVARRRYVMSALLRPMGTYVRRVRTNLERLQNRVNQLQAAASSVGGNSQNQRPGGFVDAAAIETIRRRIDDISKRISDIVNRIRFSLTPTSAPLNNNGRK